MFLLALRRKTSFKNPTTQRKCKKDTEFFFKKWQLVHQGLNLNSTALKVSEMVRLSLTPHVNGSITLGRKRSSASRNIAQQPTSPEPWQSEEDNGAIQTPPGHLGLLRGQNGRKKTL